MVLRHKLEKNKQKTNQTRFHTIRKHNPQS